jgi:hypothetical protein
MIVPPALLSAATLEQLDGRRSKRILRLQLEVANMGVQF